MKRTLTLALCSLLVAAPLYGATKEEKRLTNSGIVMEEILNIPENIPEDLLQKAECVIVIPSVRKAAFIFGGSYGRGAMVCRTGKAFNGPWGAPAMYALEGGSFGFQIGGQATDMVLLVMNEKGANSILDSKVKLGAGISVAAGPKGRDTQASTDAYMQAEILSYSRSQGLFAGISLQGSTLRPDNDASARIYGRKITAREIVLGNQVTTTAAGRHFVAVLQKGAARNQSDQASTR